MHTEPAYIKRFFAGLADCGARVETLRYARPEAGGETCAWRLSPKGKSRGTVVFSHATGNDALYPQLSLFRRLLASGWEIFTYDLDGHGRQATAKLGATAVRTAVAAACSQAGGGGVHLIGQSLGGALALAAAAAGHVTPRSLTLISAPLHLAPKAWDLSGELKSLARPALYAQMRHYGAYGLMPALGPFKRKTYPVRLLAGSGPDYIAAVTALINGLGLAAAAAKLAEVPTLLVYGAHDKIVPPEQGRALAACMAGSELFLVPNGTHFTTLFEPSVEAVITAFLARHGEPQS